MVKMNNFNYGVIPYRPEDGISPHSELGNLEGVLQEAFRSEGKRIIRAYFEPRSPIYPQRLEFVVEATKAVEDEPLAGALVATLETTGSIKFVYYDKIGVAPPYQDNGVMGRLLTHAAKAGANRGIYISALRTTIPRAHKRYTIKSDIRTKIRKYYIHGFGFIDKKTGREKFDNARKKFREIARYIASLPPTAVPIEQAALE